MVSGMPDMTHNQSAAGASRRGLLTAGALRQWWAASWSQAPRIAWQHIPTSRGKAARAAAFGLLRALRDQNDGTLTRRPVIGYTTARTPASPVTPEGLAR